MSTFAVITTSAIPDGTRGALTRWMIEPAPGVYVGTLTARVREYLWDAVRESIDEQYGWVALIHDSDTEQGYAVRTHGTGNGERSIVDLDGVSLVSWPVLEGQGEERTLDHKSITHW
ncbi:type I-E CRISPR-associated endoribonuclease Cas2 [Actinopolyspora erythraea]|uniref:Type I-E CRISPR-associated endoribonuclease Cas2 n=1 Tax=Actinopolyspora erythraea TaxID=414996 RepID=A0A223RVE2_9ACTN|nr:type I-E CRISPR-associated endoribonuclease Cas2e [Actinopolyspora erythraea]ASU79840.1 type I-E CRISPR-associated endoribonuclease Cas2 [Actinopolyspora erythraea]